MYYLLVLLSMMSIVSGSSLAKGLFQDLGPETTTLVRLFIASLLMTAVWRPWRFKIDWAEFRAIALYGFALGFLNFTFYLAIEKLPMGLAVAIEFLGPIAVAIFSSRKLLDILWVALTIVGIVMILPIADTQKQISMLGVFYALISATMWALYIVQGKKIAAQVKPAVAAPLGMFLGSLCVLPFGFKNLGVLLNGSTLLLKVCVVGLMSSAIPYSLEMVAMKKIPAKQFSLLLSLEPVFAALAGFIFLKEHLSFVQISAIGCILTASVGSILASE